MKSFWLITFVIFVSNCFSSLAFVRFIVAITAVIVLTTIICIAATLATRMHVFIASHTLVARTISAIIAPLLAFRSPAALLLRI
jgi:hypothetical protein